MYDVNEYIEDYGTNDYLGSVSKVLKIGVSICNPVDEFDERVGTLKSISRARSSKPVLFAADPGVINSRVVEALLKQEASYLKNNPEKFIPGYLDMKNRYLTNCKMEAMKEGFTDIENQVVEGLQKDPRFLDRAMKYLNWILRQKRGTKCQK